MSDELRDKVGRLKTLLLNRAQQKHQPEEEREYATLHRELTMIPEVRAALPQFVRDNAPNIRRYSRLNCDGLSYPTRNAATVWLERTST